MCDLGQMAQFSVLASPLWGGCKGSNEIMNMEAITQCLAHS